MPITIFGENSIAAFADETLNIKHPMPLPG